MDDEYLVKLYLSEVRLVGDADGGRDEPGQAAPPG